MTTRKANARKIRAKKTTFQTLSDASGSVSHTPCALRARREQGAELTTLIDRDYSNSSLQAAWITMSVVTCAFDASFRILA
jgi:hypothetical protein